MLIQTVKQAEAMLPKGHVGFFPMSSLGASTTTFSDGPSSISLGAGGGKLGSQVLSSDSTSETKVEEKKIGSFMNGPLAPRYLDYPILWLCKKNRKI